jgi:hypothetical protein
LTLKNPKSTVYTCYARNLYGETSSKVFLTIENPARILSITSNRTILINERLNIYCLVEGDQVIFKTPSKEKRYENTKNISLIIDHIQMTDSGLYECYVKNNYSEERSVFEIIVQNYPDKIENIFFDNLNRIFWTKPFDGNSKILKYILYIRYKQGQMDYSIVFFFFSPVFSHLGSSWSNETIITVENNQITNYSFENIFSKCTIAVIIQAVNAIGLSLPSDSIYFQTTIQRKLSIH